jgi:hypothetical protein
VLFRSTRTELRTDIRQAALWLGRVPEWCGQERGRTRQNQTLHSLTAAAFRRRVSSDSAMDE